MSKSSQEPQPYVTTEKDVERIRNQFPAEMIELPQWVPYCLRWGEKTGKFDKIPMNPNTGYNAKSNKSETWGSFEIAVKRALKRKLGGVGFVFSKDDPYVGIDLDKCINDDGEVEKWATEIIAELNSYTELSPSRKGYHIIGRGQLPPRGRRKDRIEMYDSNRFFTVTGLDYGIGKIRNFQEELNQLHARTFKKAHAKRTTSRPNGRNPPVLNDDEIIAKAIRSNNGLKFEMLWRGDWEGAGYPSQSEADQALCNHLAWWTNYDEIRLDALFRRSGLSRPEKWDKQHYSDGRTYGQGTIENALAGHSLGDGYDPTIARGSLSVKRKKNSKIAAISINRQLSDVLSDTWDMVFEVNRKNNQPSLFLRSGQVVKIREDEGNPIHIELMNKDTVNVFLFENADWVVETEDYIKPAKPPREITNALVSDPHPGLPQLENVMSTPFIGHDGGLITTNGYHESNRSWLQLSHDLAGIIVPKNPSSTQVSDAISLFNEDLLIDFPFVTQADCANAIAAFLLPFVRQMVDGPTPLHLIDAPTPGSGKGLLANLISIVATGEGMVIQTLPYQEEELRKRISSELLKGRPIIGFDNAETRRRLDSGTLAAVLTANIWSDRLLGQNKDITVRNRSMWLLTGNNLQTSSEIADRVMWIRIDPKMERPREREGFKHDSIEEWTLENRRILVEAALTMVSAWVHAGQPYSGTKIGSFENWTRVIGGILQFCGIDGFLQNREKFYEHADEENEMWRAFVKDWWSAFATEPVTAKALYGLCEDNDLMVSVRGDKTERSQQTRLGKALKSARDRTIGNFRIQIAWARNPSGNLVTGYQLIELEDKKDMKSEDESSLDQDEFLDDEVPF